MKLSLLPCLVVLLMMNKLSTLMENLRVMNGSHVQRYITANRVYSFNDAVCWCQGLGGHLPFIHSQDDLDFLVRTILDKKSSRGDTTWIGLDTEGDCSTYLNGSPVDYAFQFANRSNCKTSLNLCWATQCGLKLFSNKNKYKEVAFGSIASRSVCIIEESIISDYLQTQRPRLKAEIILEMDNASHTWTQVLQLHTNLTALLSKIEEDNKSWQTNVFMFMTFIAAFVFVAFTILFLTLARKRFFKLIPS